MEWYSQNRFEVRLEWGLAAVDYLAEETDCAVIVDVMSFSTCVSLAVENGARIYPYSWKDESANEYGMKIGAKVANPNRRFNGEDYSLSPVSIQNITDGEKLVLPSPNGSAISFRARDVGIEVFSGCFRNMSATANACSTFKRILIIPCGERWPDGSIRPCVEDYVAAGGIIAAIGRRNCSPEARAALAAWQFYQQQNLRPLYECSSASELQQRGFQRDVELCLETDTAKLACQLYGDVYASGLE
ncbi:TPA: 2-phosphosulfolactate phosphatase [Serratia liquefaciens]|uniref:2-phosphosulfolactate phosphatase n=1 Tax=Serratia liquefaciens TaxID=614 RepID=UPI0021C6B9BD|nr:2-phosphosulfolactate phosphatase [Serratia liquefaciens]MDU4176246.1 2-phosphosulfolactate phosphatase [Serratia liquefaciens]